LIDVRDQILSVCRLLVKQMRVRRRWIFQRPMPGALHALPSATGAKYREPMGEVNRDSFWKPPYTTTARR